MKETTDVLAILSPDLKGKGNGAGWPSSTCSLNGNGDGMAFYMLSKLEVRLEGRTSTVSEGE